MQYGYCSKENESGKLQPGDVFMFREVDSYGFRYCQLAEEDDYTRAQWSEAVEITKEGYDRLSPKSEPSDIHPKLLKAFKDGDWGCQEESVRKYSEAITAMFEELKK